MRSSVCVEQHKISLGVRLYDVTITCGDGGGDTPKTFASPMRTGGMGGGCFM